MQTGLSVSLVGTGNVAHHLARAFHRAGVNLAEIAGRNAPAVHALADQVNAAPQLTIPEMKPVDAVILCISDDAIPEVSGLLPSDQFRAHTSGSVAMDKLGAPRSGVFYPLQTFSRDVAVDFAQVPILLETSAPNDYHTLESLAESLTGRIHAVHSEQRQAVHLSAVLVSNFTNHLYRLAEEHLRQDGLHLDILRPLILETARKVQAVPPAEAQTGPARRGDLGVMNAHLQRLANDADMHHLYAFMSDLISKAYHGPEL